MHRPLFSLRLPAHRVRVAPPSLRNFSSTSGPTSTFRKAAYVTLFTLTAGVSIVYYFDSRAAIHRYLITPVIRNALDPESGHKLAVSVLENGLGPRDMLPDDERLETEVKGTTHALPTENEIDKSIFSFGVKHCRILLASQLGSTKTVEQLMVPTKYLKAWSLSVY